MSLENNVPSTYRELSNEADEIRLKLKNLDESNKTHRQSKILLEIRLEAIEEALESIGKG